MARQTYSWNDTVLTPEQAAQALWQAGLRDYGIMAQLVAIAKRESGYRAGIHGSDSARERVSGDRGVWQINAGTDFENGLGNVDRQLIAAGIIQRPEDLFDPVTNARAAIFLLGGANSSPQSMQNAINHHWGAGPGGWVGASGDPLYGTDLSIGTNAVQSAQTTGLFGPDAPPVPTSITSGAASGAAGPGANPGTGELGFINANAQNQREYYLKQTAFHDELFKLAQTASNLQFNELEANKLFQNALHGIYTDVNRAQGIFNTKEYEELKKNLGNLRALAKDGLQDTAKYRDLQMDLEKKTLTATINWLNKQRGFADRTAILAKSEAAFVHGQKVRDTFSDAASKGAVHSRGFGLDLAEHDTEQSLRNKGIDLTRDVDYASLANQDTMARIGYQGNVGQISNSWQQYLNQYGMQQEAWRHAGVEGRSRYEQTARNLWAKARELAAQKTLQDRMVDINYDSLENQRDVTYQQYLQGRHSLENQHTQVGVNQLRDITSLNQARQQAATNSLLSLSPYG